MTGYPHHPAIERWDFLHYKPSSELGDPPWRAGNHLEWLPQRIADLRMHGALAGPHLPAFWRGCAQRWGWKPMENTRNICFWALELSATVSFHSRWYFLMHSHRCSSGSHRQATARHLRMFHSWLKEHQHLEELQSEALRLSSGSLRESIRGFFHGISYYHYRNINIGIMGFSYIY